jgi:hypothetical protein
MTGHVHSLTVVLDHDVREDDVQHVIDAIGMVRCVLSVTPIVADSTSHMAEKRAGVEWSELLYAILRVTHTYKQRAALKRFLEDLKKEDD